MNRKLYLMLASLLFAIGLAATAAAQSADEEDDPFAEDPFSDEEDPFNDTQEEDDPFEGEDDDATFEEAANEAEDTQRGGAGTGDPTRDADSSSSGGDEAKATPGAPLVAVLAGAGLAALVSTRRRG